MFRKTIDTKIGILLVALVAIITTYAIVTYAHHNSPMRDTIEENENFDNMGMHEAALDDLSDNSNMDDATTRGNAVDTAEQTGAADGPDGTNQQSRQR